jgi:hypothetical protein
LQGAFFVNARILFYLYLVRVSVPLLGTNFIETPEISGVRSIVHAALFLTFFYLGFIRKWKRHSITTYDQKQREDSRGRHHLDARHGGGRLGNGFKSHSGGRDFPLTGSTADARTRSFCWRPPFGPWTVRIEGKPDTQEIHVAGDYAFYWNQLSLAVTPLQGGPVQRHAGPTLSVFRKEPNGRWILFRDANMLSAV